MIVLKIPGFSAQVVDICRNVFKSTLEDLMGMDGDLRSVLKEKLVVIQGERIRKQMITLSKTDGLLMNSFAFDGKRRKYLDLPFTLARITFMVRCKMILTKDNFPGRWEGSLCNVCKSLDTVEHLFGCPGYSDLLDGTVSYQTFFAKEMDLVKLRSAAELMVKVNDRLKVVQEL